MVKYDYKYQLGAGQGDSRRANNLYAILHDTANDNNQGPDAAENEADFMRRNWQSAYTQGIAGHSDVKIVGEPGYVAYGAMASGNLNSPWQVELTHYTDKNLALKSYANWVNSTREQAKKFGIPLTLDAGDAGTPGVKTHAWISNTYLESDHMDPWGYLARLGINFEKVQNDLLHGVGEVAPNKGWKWDGSYWFFYENGEKVRDKWKKISNVWYLFDKHGAMYANAWVKRNNKWYYLQSSGGMATGWRIVSGKWYHLNNDGAMTAGWLKQGNTWYYLEGNGSMKTGWYQDKAKKWYYLSKPNGAMVANTTTAIDGKTYKFNASGACLNP